MTTARTDLELAFAIPGQVFRGDDGEAIAVRVEPVGELVLDGVAVGDPLASERMELTPPQGRLALAVRIVTGHRPPR